MNQQQIRLLSKMKSLIKNGKRKFKERKDRNYLDDLYNLSLTLKDAWKEILSLNKNFYFNDNMPFYNQTPNCLTFKKTIKGKLSYIKLILENDEVVVCWSFHEDKDKLERNI